MHNDVHTFQVSFSEPAALSLSNLHSFFFFFLYITNNSSKKSRIKLEKGCCPWKSCLWTEGRSHAVIFTLMFNCSLGHLPLFFSFYSSFTTVNVNQTTVINHSWNQRPWCERREKAYSVSTQQPDNSLTGPVPADAAETPETGFPHVSNSPFSCYFKTLFNFPKKVTNETLRAVSERHLYVAPQRQDYGVASGAGLSGAPRTFLSPGYAICDGGCLTPIRVCWEWNDLNKLF